MGWVDDGPSASTDKGAAMRHDFDVMVEFLKARLREDESAAKALKPSKSEDVARLRDRILADVEAKRRLMDWVFAPQRELGSGRTPSQVAWSSNSGCSSASR